MGLGGWNTVLAAIIGVININQRVSIAISVQVPLPEIAFSIDDSVGIGAAHTESINRQDLVSFDPVSILVVIGSNCDLGFSLGLGITVSFDFEGSLFILPIISRDDHISIIVASISIGAPLVDCEDLVVPQVVGFAWGLLFDIDLEEISVNVNLVAIFIAVVMFVVIIAVVGAADGA